MEIYLKHREGKSLVCLRKTGKHSYDEIVLESFMRKWNCIEFNSHEDESLDEGHKWYAERTDLFLEQGEWSKLKRWIPSSRDEFKAALKEFNNNRKDVTEFLTFTEPKARLVE